MTAVGYVGGDPTKVSRSGDTMTGDLGLPGDPDAALEATPKQYVDSSAGTTANTYSVGDGATGAKAVRFNGAGALLLQSTPTTARTVTIPDASGAVLLGPDNQVEQVIAWSALDRWLRVNTPFSAGDTNPDLLRIFNGANQVWRLNGNGENRWLPSDINRVGGRAFEFQDGSNDIFWECSTNPSAPGVRETLLGVYGTLHSTRPGWVLVRETVLARALQTSSPITVSGNATYPGTGWQNATLNANVSAGTAIAPATQLEGRRVFMRGRLSWVTQTFGAGTVLLTVHADHRPLTTKTFSVRTSANSSVAVILELSSNGQLTNNATLGTTTTAFLGLDGLNYDLS